MIDRYSFDDWLNYGRRGKREYSCFRFYSVGLNRGMPLVILDALKKIGFGGIFVWLPTLFAEKLLTDENFLGSLTTLELMRLENYLLFRLS